jgi:hypothetical protein
MYGMYQAMFLQHLDIGGRAIGGVGPDGAGGVGRVEYRAELCAVVRGGVGDVEAPDESVLAVDADRVHRRNTIKRASLLTQGNRSQVMLTMYRKSTTDIPSLFRGSHAISVQGDETARCRPGRTNLADKDRMVLSIIRLQRNRRALLILDHNSAANADKKAPRDAFLQRRIVVRRYRAHSQKGTGVVCASKLEHIFGHGFFLTIFEMGNVLTAASPA